MPFVGGQQAFVVFPGIDVERNIGVDGYVRRGEATRFEQLDRADDEFEAFLLELLSDFQITIPEVGTIAAEGRPIVVLTSNRTRELHDALKRRCLYHWIGYPSINEEIDIVQVSLGAGATGPAPVDQRPSDGR